MPVLIKWFPPSWIQIKTQDKIIYIDPAYMRTHFTNYPKRIEFSKWPDPIDGLPEKLEKADIILITHNHKDHVKRVTVDRLGRRNTRIIAPQRCIKELGNTIEVIKAGDEITDRYIKIKVIESYNTLAGNSTKKVHKKGYGVGYVLTINDKTIYHAGDTDLIAEMKKLKKIDIAFLPIGGTFTMDITEAVKTAFVIKPKTIIPIHYNKADPQEFKNKIETNSDIKVKVLQTGEVYRL